MKISTRITKLMLLALFLVPKVNFSQNHSINAKGTQIQVSSNLQTVLDQAETVYAIPSNITFNDVYNKAPTAIPFFLGLIMQRQDIMMKEIRNIEHLNNSNVLEDEIMTFLSQLAEAHNNLDPINNTSMIPAKLQVFYYEALKGNQNDNSKNNFGIDPTTVNIAYILDRVPSNTTPSNIDDYGKIRLAEKKNEINLFGEVSGDAENNYNPPTFNEELLNSEEEDSLNKTQITGCSNAMFSIKLGSSEKFGMFTCQFHNINLNFGNYDKKTNNISESISKVFVVINSKYGRTKELELSDNPSWHTKVRLSHYFPLEKGDRIQLAFIALDSDGEIVCTGKTQSTFIKGCMMCQPN